MTKRKGQSITIRLDDELADKLQDVATRHKVARSAVIVDLLTGNLDDWQPGTTGQDRGKDDGTALARHDELLRAIEVIRLELDEFGERVSRLERQDRARPGKTPIALPPDGLTQKAVLATIGVSRSTARDRAKKAGLSLGDWIESNYPYRRSGKLWISQLET